jgi:hypothetical protein
MWVIFLLPVVFVMYCHIGFLITLALAIGFLVMVSALILSLIGVVTGD